FQAALSVLPCMFLVELYRISTSSCCCATSNARTPCSYSKSCLSPMCSLGLRYIRLPQMFVEEAPSSKCKACNWFCSILNPGHSKNADPLKVLPLRILLGCWAKPHQLRVPIQPRGES